MISTSYLRTGRRIKKQEAGNAPCSLQPKTGPHASSKALCPVLQGPLSCRARPPKQASHLRPGWTGMGQNGLVRVLCLCAILFAQVFLLKRKRGEICIRARLPFLVKMSSTSRPAFSLLLRETRQHRQPERIMQRCSDNCASLRSRRCLPRFGAFYSQTTNSLSVIHHDVLLQAPGQAWTRN